MTKWEYMTISGNPIIGPANLISENEEHFERFLGNTHKRLENLGKEGWEVVCSHVMTIPKPKSFDSGKDILTYCLKRPLE